MNPIKKLMKLRKRMDKYERFINRQKGIINEVQKWIKHDKAKFYELLNTLTESEQLLYGQKMGYMEERK